MSENNNHYTITNLNNLNDSRIRDNGLNNIVVNYNPNKPVLRFIYPLLINPWKGTFEDNDFFNSSIADGAISDGSTSGESAESIEALKGSIQRSSQSNDFVQSLKAMTRVLLILGSKIFTVQLILFTLISMINYIIFSLTGKTVPIPPNIAFDLFINITISLAFTYLFKLIPIIGHLYSFVLPISMFFALTTPILTLVKTYDNFIFLYVFLIFFLSIQSIQTLIRLFITNKLFFYLLMLLSYTTVFISLLNPSNIQKSNGLNPVVYDYEISLFIIALFSSLILTGLYYFIKHETYKKIEELKQYFIAPKLFKTSKVEYTGFLGFTESSYNFSPTQAIAFIKKGFKFYEDEVEANDYSKVYGSAFYILVFVLSFISAFKISGLNLTTPFISRDKSSLTVKVLASCEKRQNPNDIILSLSNEERRMVEFYGYHFKTIFRACNDLYTNQAIYVLTPPKNSRKGDSSLYYLINTSLEEVSNKYSYVIGQPQFSCLVEHKDFYLQSFCKIVAHPFFKNNNNNPHLIVDQRIVENTKSIYDDISQVPEHYKEAFKKKYPKINLKTQGWAVVAYANEEHRQSLGWDKSFVTVYKSTPQDVPYMHDIVGLPYNDLIQMKLITLIYEKNYRFRYK